MSNKKKVLLIGWDAADWKVINPLMDAGQMPALESLVNQGVMGNIATLDPPFSPMLWTSIATGKTADKHGILGFTEPDPEGIGMRPITASSRKVKAIWNILTQKGYKTHVVGWWPSHPVEPINGIMLSNNFAKCNQAPDKWAMPDKTVHPENLSRFFSELRIHPSELTQEHLLPFVPKADKIDQSKDNRIYQLAKSIAEASSYHAAATWIMDNQEWDFMAVYLDTIDHLCHGFMNYHPPKMKNISENEFEVYKDVINSTYRFHDMMLDTLLKKTDEDTTVILISDHGFHSDHLRPSFIPSEPAGPAYQHRDYGIICMKGPGIKKDERIYGASLMNITPTILNIYGLPIGEDMDAAPLVQAFESNSFPNMIPSWDEVDGYSGMLDGEKNSDPKANFEELKQLIELGYVEDPGENVKEATTKAFAEQNYNLSRVYLGSNRYDKAIPLLEELQKKDPTESRFALNLLTAYLETNLIEKAESLHKECTELYPKLVLSNENIEKLKEEINKSIEQDPINSEDKLIKEKQEKIKKSLTLRMAIVQLKLIELDILIHKNKFNEALVRIKEISKSMPDRKLLNTKLANLHLGLKNWKEAEALFINLLKIDPENPKYHDGLAIAYLNQQKYEDAAGSALDAVGLMHFFPYAHFHLGEALFQLESYEHAANAYEISLQQIPKYGKSRNRLIEIYEKHLPNAEKLASHIAYFESENSNVTTKKEEVQAINDIEFKNINRNLKDSVFIVSGLPRSGTSMMMQMMETAGIQVLTDGIRKADENNPKGYYEHEGAKSLARNKVWLKDAQGKVVKIIAQQLKHLPEKYNYNIIFMLRDIREIIASQHAMLDREGKKSAYPLALENSFRKSLLQITEWAKKRHNVAITFINHANTIEQPLVTASIIKELTNSKSTIENLACVVDKKLYRQKNKN
ncbi:MAG: tetratricopeptide repeat protein [Bacteroidales bacterium]|nr:tetratricopeptide repeat protein [Bacteroidales bacterium]